MITITIKDKTAALVFDMTSWEEIEDKLKICFPEGVMEPLKKPKVRITTICTLAEIMSREGARKGKGDLMTAEWLKENCSPKQFRQLDKLITEATDEGFKMESKSEDEAQSGTVDIALQEIEKKDSQAD